MYATRTRSATFGRTATYDAPLFCDECVAAVTDPDGFAPRPLVWIGSTWGEPFECAACGRMQESDNTR